MMKRRSAPLLLTLAALVSGCDSVIPESLVSGLAPLGGVQWGQYAPRFADFDGDGVLDVFGWVNEWNGQLNPRIAGYDGRTGERLWITPTLGVVGEAHYARMGLVGGYLIVADSGGTARAFRPGEDAVVWSVGLGERADAICSGGPGQVIVRTVDERATVIDLTNGDARPTAAPTDCRLDEYVQARFRPDFMTIKAKDGEALRALSAEDERFREVAPDLSKRAVIDVSRELQVLVGTKRGGTPVPMVAVVRGGRLAWSSVAPAEDPLRAGYLVPVRAAADERGVFVGYERGSEQRIAAFAMADGRRLWDVAVPQMPEGSSSIDALGVTPERLYVAHRTYLSALDRETGEALHTIGQRR